MKNKMFKLMTLIGSGILAAGMLVGCGGSNDTPASTESSQSTDATDATDATATEAASADTATDGTIVMGTNAEFEPFEYRENGTDVVGFDVDIAQKIADKLGKKLVIEDMAFDSLIMALNSDKINFIAAGMTANDERRKQVDFSDPYFKSKQLIIVKADDESIQSADDLKGKKVGVQLGTTGDLFVSGTEGIGSVVQFPNGPAAMMDLKNGQIDAIVIDEEPAKKMTEGQSDLKLLDTPFVEEEYAIAVKKGDSELLKAINETLAEIKADGSYDELSKKYFSDAEN